MKQLYYTNEDAPREVEVIEPIKRDEYFTLTDKGHLMSCGLFPLEAKEDLEQQWESVCEAKEKLSKTNGQLYAIINKYKKISKMSPEHL